jgi:hypothetical protein
MNFEAQLIKVSSGVALGAFHTSEFIDQTSEQISFITTEKNWFDAVARFVFGLPYIPLPGPMGLVNDHPGNF